MVRDPPTQLFRWNLTRNPSGCTRIHQTTLQIRIWRVTHLQLLTTAILHDFAHSSPCTYHHLVVHELQMHLCAKYLDLVLSIGKLVHCNHLFRTIANNSNSSGCNSTLQSNADRYHTNHRSRSDFIAKTLPIIQPTHQRRAILHHQANWIENIL